MLWGIKRIFIRDKYKKRHYNRNIVVDIPTSAMDYSQKKTVTDLIRNGPKEEREQKKKHKKVNRIVFFRFLFLHYVLLSVQFIDTQCRADYRIFVAAFIQYFLYVICRLNGDKYLVLYYQIKAHWRCDNAGNFCFFFFFRFHYFYSLWSFFYSLGWLSNAVYLAFSPSFLILRFLIQFLVSLYFVEEFLL